MEEFGFAGTTIYAGFVHDDFNPDLQSPKSIATYDRMRRSDGQVRAIETVISLPIRTVRFYVEPGDDSASGREAAALIETNLLAGDGMSITFDDLVRKALISVLLGFQVFEKVYQEDGGYIRFRKFADRHPKTVYRWQFDEAGGIAGIVQRGTAPDGTSREVTIPAEKLLRFTFCEEWGNPEGFALCRSMYKHWWIKDALYRITNIGAERDWVGTPVGRAPANASKGDREEFLRTLEALSTAEGSAVVLPSGYELDSYHGATRTDAIIAYLEHHDVAMAKCALAAFINLVGQSQGSRALSADQSQFFLLCEQAIANWLCSIINAFAIRPMIGWNFPGITAYPRLEHSDIGTVVQPVQIAHGLAALVNKQLISVDDGIENAVRDIMNLPEIPPEQLGRDRTPPPAFPPGQKQPPAAQPPQAALQGPRRAAADAAYHQGQLPPASRPVDTERIRRDFSSADDEVQKIGRNILEKQLAGFEKAATPIIDQAAKASPLERGKAHLALADLQVPYQAEYTQWLRDLLMSVVQAGMEAAAAETGSRAGAIPNELRSFVQAQAMLLSDKHATDLRFAAVNRLQLDLASALGRRQVMVNMRQAMQERAAANMAVSMADAFRAVTDQVSASLAGI